MNRLVWWMRIVGVFYLLQFVMMAIVRAPIRAQGPPGTLDLANAGDPVAGFVVDTWLTFGLEVAAIGIALLVASRYPTQARGVVWTVLAIEVLRGVVNDLWFIPRGDMTAFYLAWIAIHSTVIVTGLLALRASRANGSETAERHPAAAAA